MNDEQKQALREWLGISKIDCRDITQATPQAIIEALVNKKRWEVNFAREGVSFWIPDEFQSEDRAGEWTDPQPTLLEAAFVAFKRQA